MKVGDKYICIKNVEHYYKNFKRISHSKGKIYEVAIESKKMHDIEYVYMISEDTTTSNGYLGFFINSNSIICVIYTTIKRCKCI